MVLFGRIMADEHVIVVLNLLTLGSSADGRTAVVNENCTQAR